MELFLSSHLLHFARTAACLDRDEPGGTTRQARVFCHLEDAQRPAVAVLAARDFAHLSNSKPKHLKARRRASQCSSGRLATGSEKSKGSLKA